MKENKLTLEDAMKYPKAEYSINDWKGKIIEINIPKNSLRLESETGTSFGVSVSDCKLILRSIEKLTKEEEDKLFQIRDSKTNGGCLKHNGAMLLYYVQRDYADYLRSISVDIDGFVDSGKATYEIQVS